MKQLQHLLWRMGFGPQTETWPQWSTLTPAEAWRKLKADAAAPPAYFDVADNAVKGLVMGVGEVGKMERRKLDQAQRKRLREQSRDDLRNLNLLWLEQMTHSKAQLREKMALFWHGHFAAHNINILYQQQLLSIIRENALGNFADLLRQVSKSAAMLAFLNNQQNKKEHPNENFAREVMELFTLGRGNYTEQDIKEAARAFTGWSFRLDGQFQFRPNDHDTGSKTIFGKTGNFKGEDVLDMLLERRETAVSIVRKLYRFLVNEQKAPEARIALLADRFFQNKYDILALLDDIAGSAWFYEPENIGANIKSPVVLWVGIRRTLPMQVLNPEAQLVIQKVLGQVLFYPPNVAGWPGGRSWIDSNTLTLRLRLPQLVYGQKALEVRGKTDDDQEMGQGRTGKGRKVEVALDWAPVEAIFQGAKTEDLFVKIAEYLWQAAPTRDFPVEVLEAHTDPRNRESLMHTAYIQLMATPEYQLF